MYAYSCYKKKHVASAHEPCSDDDAHKQSVFMGETLHLLSSAALCATRTHVTSYPVNGFRIRRIYSSYYRFYNSHSRVGFHRPPPLNIPLIPSLTRPVVVYIRFHYGRSRDYNNIFPRARKTFYRACNMRMRVRIIRRQYNIIILYNVV